MKLQITTFSIAGMLALALGTVPCSAGTLTIDADGAAARAVEASSVSRAAADRVEASTHKVEAADGARWPVLTANAGYIRHSNVPEFGVPTDDPNQPFQVLFPNIPNNSNIDLTLRQPIYTGGAIAADREAARHDRSATTWSQSLSVIELAHAGRVLYWTAVAAEAGEGVAGAQLERTRRLLDDARALRAAGMAVNADVFAAEARLASAEVDFIRTRNESERAKAALRSLLAIDGKTTLALADTATRRVPAPPEPLADLEAEALENRPEIRVADARIKEFGARARSVNAARLPQVAASGQYLFARPNQRYLPPVDEANDSWRVGVAASWQLFDGHRTGARVAGVEAEQRALEQDLGELRRQIALDVTTARLDLESALEAVIAADASAAAARAWEEASAERYAAGLAQMSELLDAQTDLTAAEAAQVRARVNAWIAETALHRAVGR